VSYVESVTTFSFGEHTRTTASARISKYPGQQESQKQQQMLAKGQQPQGLQQRWKHKELKEPQQQQDVSNSRHIGNIKDNQKKLGNYC
jgi:hypothetical protein